MTGLLPTASVITAAIVLVTVVGIAYGGTFLLRVVRRTAPANALQEKFFRAGHAHAGVLVILGLVILLYTSLAEVPGWSIALARSVLYAAILMPAGFFLSVIGRDPQRPNRLIVLLWVGAAALVVGLLGAAAGLIVAAAT